MLQSVPQANFEFLLSAIRHNGKPVSFRKRQVIFSAGSPCDSLYFIEEGLAKISVNSSDGREAIILVKNKGHFLGLDCLQDDIANVRESGGVALTNFRAWRIERQAMLEMLRDNREFSQIFVFHLVGLIHRLSMRLSEGLLYASEERLARTLLLVDQFRGDDEYHLPRGLSQLELAHMIGTTRQRVNEVMQQFRTLGMVDSQGAAFRNSIQEIISQDGHALSSKQPRRSSKSR